MTGVAFQSAALAREHIGYDARLALGNYRGMGAWMRDLIRGRERELLGFCATGESDPMLHLHSEGLRFFPLWEQCSLPRRVEEAKVTTLLCPWNTAPLRLAPHVRLILVVHDLIFLESFRDLPLSRSIYQNAGRLYRRLIAPRALHRANAILVPSHTVERQIVEIVGADPTTITTIPNTIAPAWFEEPAIEAKDRNEFVVLCISGEAPSKNLERALEALAQVEREASHRKPFRLIIGGVAPRFHRRFDLIARNKGFQVPIEFLPFLTAEELRRVYHHADLLFVPSLYEGFGRPVLEGMAMGVPVVAADLPVFREIGEDAIQPCDPHSSHSMAQALLAALTHPERCRSMQAKGRRQALRYHPDEVRKQIDRFWRSLDPRREGSHVA